MENFLTPDLLIALGALAVALVGGLSAWIKVKLQKKADLEIEAAQTEAEIKRAEKRKKYVALARETVMDIVRSLQETNVKAMKEANGGTLTQLDIEKLKYEMIKTLKVMLPKEILEFLEETSEDFEGLVQVLVDGAIFLLKSGFFASEDNMEAAGPVLEND
jgi:hypothetical protein